MALKIASTNPRFMVQAGEGLVRVPYEDWSNDVEKVSFMYNKIEELPSRPLSCPRLITLLLKKNYSEVLLIPNSFFTHMQHLKVLDLSNTKIQSLPESISKLENLHALLLTDCPTLKIKRTKVEVSAEELLCLRRLKVLEAQFHNVQELTSYVTVQQFQNLESYNVVVGIVHKNDIHNELYEYNPKAEEGCSYETKSFVSIGLDCAVPPSDIESLDIIRWNDLISLSDIQSLCDAKDLRKCEIRSCNGLESKFSSACFLEDYQILLRAVEELWFEDLPNFRVLFDGVIPLHNIFSFNLKKLYFIRCSSIKNIFPAKLLRNFPNLEKLTVSECKNLEEIIVEVEMSEQGGHRQNDGIRNIFTLRNFKYLTLTNLPRLKSIYKGQMVCESLQYIHVRNCPMLRRLPISLHMNGDGEQAFAPLVLKHIYGEQEWWESLQWENLHTKPTLQSFFSSR
ncbi:putative disease resistance protein At4g10780 [Camellia sinensis]|nr:putative disease resistance protein At4g10780 [Camellia sinensis]